MFLKIRGQYYNLDNVVRVSPNNETGDITIKFTDGLSVTVNETRS